MLFRNVIVKKNPHKDEDFKVIISFIVYLLFDLRSKLAEIETRKVFCSGLF